MGIYAMLPLDTSKHVSHSSTNLKRTRSFQWACLTTLFLTFLNVVAQKQNVPTEKVPVIDLRVTSNMDSSIGDGGIDIRVKGGTFYQPQLSLCSQPVDVAATKWASTNKLDVLKSVTNSDGILVQMANVKAPGFFELIYRLDPKNKIASVSLMFYKSDGTPVLPELITSVDNKALTSLQEELTKAITCVATSK
jgi:hypothetical protein